MAPTPTPETAPALDPSLVSKSVVPTPTNLYLGPNTTVKGDSIQSTLPLVTSDAVWSNGLNVLTGSTASYILRADNLTIDKSGNLTKVGSITSTGNSTFSGSVNAGSLSTTGALSAKSVTATDGFTTTAGNFSTNTGKVSTKELQVAGTKFSVDSLAGTLSLTGTLTSTGVSITNTGSTFQIDSSSGLLKTQGNIQAGGNISTTGISSITAAGALNGASLNISDTAFKVDNLGAITGSHYSMDKDGNLSHDGNLITKGSASLANGGFLVDATGNVTKAGTISSNAVSVNGSLTTTEGINVGANAVKLSNNGTSYFVNSVNLGAAPASGSIYPIMFNAAVGSAVFASNKAAIGADGSMTLLNGATLVNSDGVKLGVTTANGTTTNKIELNSSSGNATFAGSASFLGGAATLTNTGFTMLGGDVSAKNMTASGLLNVGGAATLSSGLNVTGASTFNTSTTFKDKVTVQNEQEITGNLTLGGGANVTGKIKGNSLLEITGAATLSSTLAVSGDLSVNTDKFKVIASSGNLISKGSLTMDGFANFANNQIQLKSDGSLYAQNFLKTDFAVANYVKSTAADDMTTTIVPAVASDAERALFNSSTNKYLTTQEYVDKAVFKQAARLNLITKDIDTNLATFNNFSKVLAAIEGSSAATVINGLVDSVDDIKISVSDLMGGGYNSVVINCVPSVWGDGAAPEPIPTPISTLYKEDGWFYSNMSSDSKINWYFPAYSGMKVKDITNLFVNNFLLSTMKLPKITIFTAPKNNSTDAISGVYNAKIEYYFSDAVPSAVTSQRSCLYLIDAPKNVYSDKSHDIKCGYSITSNGSGAKVQITFTSSTTFSNSFDTSKVTSEDSILTFAIETSESTSKDYMFILQNFNISTKNGTTQMLFQNSSVVNDYLFKYFFKQHTDFSDISLDITNVVDKNNYNGYVAGVLASSIYSTSSVSNISPLSHVTGFKTLSIGGTSVVSEGQIITFPAGTLDASLVCDLENNNDSLVITKNGATITPANTVGDYSPTTKIPLITGNNTFVVTVKDVNDNIHTKTSTFVAKVISNDTKLSSVTMNGQSVTLVSGSIPANTTKTVPAGTTSVTVVATPQSSSANVQVLGATSLHTGNNTVTLKVTAEDLTIVNNTFVVRVLSDDTSLSTFNVNGTAVLNGSSVNLPAGTTAVSVVAVPAAQTSGATAVISGASGLVQGNNTLTVLVTAESGATQTYTVTLKTLDDNNNLSSLTINGVSKNMNETLFTYSSSTTGFNIVATPASSNATVSISGIPTGTDTVVSGTTYKLKITVTAQSQLSKDYNYDIRVQSNDNNIDSIFANSQRLLFDVSNTADITLVDTTAPNSLILQANEASAATLQYKVENDGPLQSITSGVPKTVSIQQNNVSQIFVTIKPEDTAVSSKTYTINVKSRSNNTGLYAITVTPQGGSQSTVTNGQTITLASGVTSVIVDGTASYSGSTVSIDGEIGTTSSSKTITVSSGTSKVVNITVTATDEVTQNSYSVTIIAPAVDALSTFLTTNSLTLFNTTGSALQINPNNTNMKVAVCRTNNKVTLKEYTNSTTTFSDYQVVLVVSIDNGSSWNIFNYISSQGNISIYTASQYNSMNSNDGGFLTFAASAGITIASNLADTTKIVLSLNVNNIFRYLLVDTETTNNIFYKISFTNNSNSSNSFINYSKDVPNFTSIATFNPFILTYLGDHNFNGKNRPIYAGYGTANISMPFIIVPALLAQQDKNMMIQIFVNNTFTVSTVTLLSLDMSNSNTLNLNFTQNSINYTSTISMDTIYNIFTENMNGSSYALKIQPTLITEVVPPPSINLHFTNVNGSNYSFSYNIDPTNFVTPRASDIDGNIQNLYYAPNVPSDVTQLKFTFTSNTSYDIAFGYGLWECIANDNAYNDTIINLGSNLNAPMYFQTQVNTIMSPPIELVNTYFGFKRQ